MKKYKSILWLDDLDEQRKGSELSDSDCKERYFGTLHTKADGIHLVKKYSDAISVIKGMNSGSQYDLVVFDMDWKDADYDLHKAELEEGGVFLPEDMEQKAKAAGYEEVKHFFIPRAGAYLYHLLLLQGYPSSRMMILTNNDVTVPEQALSETGLKLKEFSICEKDDIKEFEEANLFWDIFFQGSEAFYYRVRRMVLHACHYWKHQLNSMKCEEIPFNIIYFSGNSESMISCEKFTETLERIEMLFPVVKPQNPERIYYQALQMAAMLHEESADIKKCQSFSSYHYHSMIRNFRNWSAHNKFQESSIDGEQFAVLFCIAMRTLFDKEQEKGFSDFYPYEKIFDFNYSYQTLENDDSVEINPDISPDNLEQKLYQSWLGLRHMSLDALSNIDEKKDEEIRNIVNALLTSGTLLQLLYLIPKFCKVKLEKKYLFLPMWCAKKEISSSVRVTSEITAPEEHSAELSNSVSFSYKWQCSEKVCQELCNTAKINSPKAVFMRYCYRWI